MSPLPVATIFSFRSGWNGVDDSGVAEWSGIGRGRNSVAMEESERISLWSSSVESRAFPDTIISETGRAPLQRGVSRGGGDWIPEERRRKNRFAFSRGPASFLRIEPRRVCLGNCSSIALRHTVRRRAERARMRLAREGSAKSGGEASLTSDRDACAEIM